MRPARFVPVLVVAASLAVPRAASAQPATWNFTQARVPAAEPAGQYGRGVTVAVLDTWVDYAHPDFGGRVLDGADCTGGTCKAGRVAPDKCEAHGTHVAGTVASTTYGVAPKARILPLRILKWDGAKGACGGNSGDVAVAIDYAVRHGAKVVNISAGSDVPIATGDTTLDAAVSNAAAKGVLVVFAAGNAQYPVSDTYGGDALIVAATARSGALASYSQRGIGVSLAAPGGEGDAHDTCSEVTCVVSTWSDGHGASEYAAVAGTSMAAPHVAGIAALLWGQQPGRTRADVVGRLTSTAHALAGAGSGRVDAAAALGVKVPAPSTAPTRRPTPRPVRPQAKTTPPPAKPAPVRTRRPAPRPTPSPSLTFTTTVGLPDDPPAPAAASRTAPATLAALLVVAGLLGVARDVAAAAKRRQHRA